MGSSIPDLLSLLCGKWVVNLHKLEDNVKALQKEMQDINAMRNDLLRRVINEGGTVVAEVKDWISSVEEMEPEANRLLDESIYEIRRLSMCGYCYSIHVSTYRYSEKVVTMLEIVRDLKSSGVFQVVTRRLHLVGKRSLLQPIFNQEKFIEKASYHLMDENVGTLGIYGMGGVGKTTLLNQINNKFLQVGAVFDLVIYVLVADSAVERIQDNIGKQLGLQWGRKSRKERAAEIFTVLNKKRFLLLLDDTPEEEVNFMVIGVPYPSIENGSKIVITTRHRGKSNWVDAELEVTLLSSTGAWELFQEKVGRITLSSHPDIPKLARIVADKCGGLPLALAVVGETMSCKRTVHEWRYAIHVLISSAPHFSEMEDKILPILKLSYDTLPGEEIKACFLYCALFPEDGYITRQDLVDYWVGEGMVSDENIGYGTINALVRASLLIEDESGYGVKMHRLIREMALWIATAFGRQKLVLVVKEGYQMPKVHDWGIVRRMSVTSTQIETIPDSPNCPALTTLFLQGNNNLTLISGDFFRWMESLVVLNMSRNRELSELPEEVSSLVSLRLLNLSWTSITHLPIGLKNLLKLIHLDLENTCQLKGIDAIPHLLNLKVVRLFGSVPIDLRIMEGIQRLENLKELTLTVADNAVLERLLGNNRLASCTRRLSILDITISTGKTSLLKVLCSLCELNVKRCFINWRSNTDEIPNFQHLCRVSFDGCKGLRDLTWLLFAPCLGDLSLIECFDIKEIINREKAKVQTGITNKQPFENLTKLNLVGLPQLESIYWSHLPFPVLQKLVISGCPNLKRLPFNSESAKGIQVQTELDQEWIQGVEWEDEDTKHRFLYYRSSTGHLVHHTWG